MASLLRLVGKGRTRPTKRTSSVQSTAQENENQRHVLVDSASSIMIATTPSEDEISKVDSRPATMPKEQDFSFPPNPTSRKSQGTKIHQRKTEALEEPGYDVVFQPSAKASFGDWTELDADKKESGPAAKAFDVDWDQFGIDKNTKEKQSSAKAASKATNWAPVGLGPKPEELPRMPSIPDWTHLDIDKKAEEPSAKPSDVEWLQLDIDKKKEEKGVTMLSIEDNERIMLETRLKEERATHLEEMHIVREEKEKLAERVKEVEEKLHQAEHELQLKMEQISKFHVDLRLKEKEIAMLKKEKEQIQQVAAREKEESLDEIRQSKDAIINSLEVANELRDEKIMELKGKLDDMQDNLANVTEDLSARVAQLESENELQAKRLLGQDATLASQNDMQDKLNTMIGESQARVAELESANKLQAKKLLEQAATLASHSEVITVLKGQKANLTTQVHTLRTNAKDTERQNSMLMVQLRQQTEDLLAWKGTIPNPMRSVRRTTGPTLVEQAVRTIKALNEEIYQTAASLTDCVDDIEKRFVDEPDNTAAALETLKSMLGIETYTELDDESCLMKDDYNPFVLLTGFQACLIACCMRIITSWYPAEPEYGKFLEAVYERIRGSGELSFLRPANMGRLVS